MGSPELASQRIEEGILGGALQALADPLEPGLLAVRKESTCLEQSCLVPSSQLSL